MKVLVYNGPGKLALEEKPKPILLHPEDCIVKVLKTTICGTDLHIKKGDVPTVANGRTLGHEGIGVIETVGSSVSQFRPGDKVLISCITSCGICLYCKEKMYSHCVVGGWQLGNTIDGTQAEYVRIPYADTSLYHLPPTVCEEDAVLFSDVLPTAFETGVLRGKIKLADTVAIVGAGPIGLAVLLSAQFFSPQEIMVVDVDEHRLQIARQLGATKVVNSKETDAAGKIMELTGNRGVDVAIEAVGVAETFDLCQKIICPGGHIANIGVHGKPVELHLESLWHHNINISTALVDTFSIPVLLKTLLAGKFTPKKLISHHFALHDIMHAYEVFGNAAKEHVLKVIIG